MLQILLPPLSSYFTTTRADWESIGRKIGGSYGFARNGFFISHTLLMVREAREHEKWGDSFPVILSLIGGWRMQWGHLAVTPLRALAIKYKRVGIPAGSNKKAPHVRRRPTGGHFQGFMDDESVSSFLELFGQPMWREWWYEFFIKTVLLSKAAATNEN